MALAHVSVVTSSRCPSSPTSPSGPRTRPTPNFLKPLRPPLHQFLQLFPQQRPILPTSPPAAALPPPPFLPWLPRSPVRCAMVVPAHARRKPRPARPFSLSIGLPLPLSLTSFSLHLPPTTTTSTKIYLPFFLFCQRGTGVKAVKYWMRSMEKKKGASQCPILVRPREFVYNFRLYCGAPSMMPQEWCSKGVGAVVLRIIAWLGSCSEGG